MRAEPVIRQSQLAFVQRSAASVAGVSIQHFERAVALAVPMELGQCPLDKIEGITVRVPHVGATRAGCDFSGHYMHVLQARMSIQYNLAAAPRKGRRHLASLRDQPYWRLRQLPD